MPAYVFLVGYDEDRPYADSLLDVSAAMGQTPEMYKLANDTAKRMGIPTESRERLLQSMSGITLRAQVTGRRVHKVITEEPIDFDTLDSVLRDKQRRGTLKSFLKESLI